MMQLSMVVSSNLDIQDVVLTPAVPTSRGNLLQVQNPRLHPTYKIRICIITVLGWSVYTIPLEKPCFGTTYRSPQLDQIVLFEEHSVYTSVSSTRWWAPGGQEIFLIISVFSVPLIVPGTQSGSTNVCLFKLSWPAGQPGTKKLDPWWNVLLHRLVVLLFLDALAFGWADAVFCLLFLKSQMV